MKRVTRRQLFALIFLLALSVLIGVSVYFCVTGQSQPLPSFYTRTQPTRRP